MTPKINPATLAAIAAGASLKTEKVQSHVADIRVVDIVPNPHQPRMSLDPVVVRDLSESIRLHGLIQPITVTRSQSGYTLISGHTRLEAHRFLGRDTIRANIIEADDDDLAMLALIENVARTDLHPLEIAMSLSRDPFASMRDDHIAAALGYSTTKVRNIRATLRLCEEVRNHLMENRPKIGVEVLVELQKFPEDSQFSYYIRVLDGEIDRSFLRSELALWKKIQARRTETASETTIMDFVISLHDTGIKIDYSTINAAQKKLFEKELEKFVQNFIKSAGGS